MARYDISAMNEDFDESDHADLAREDDQDDRPPSKSQRKRDMHALQALGVELVELSEDRLSQLMLPEGLALAVREARRIKAHEGRRRQMQYIGKLMRELDETDIAGFRAQLEAWNGRSKAETARQHAMERWRDRLISDEAALTEFMQLHAGVDAQALRTLIRNAKKEAAESRPPRAYREIFRVVREATEGKTKHES